MIIPSPEIHFRFCTDRQSQCSSYSYQHLQPLQCQRAEDPAFPLLTDRINLINLTYQLHVLSSSEIAHILFSCKDIKLLEKSSAKCIWRDKLSLELPMLLQLKKREVLSFPDL